MHSFLSAKYSWSSKALFIVCNIGKWFTQGMWWGQSKFVWHSFSSEKKRDYKAWCQEKKKVEAKENVLPILRHFIGSSLAGLYPSWQTHLPTSIVMLRKQIRSAPTQSSSLRQSTRPEIHIRRSKWIQKIHAVYVSKHYYYWR